MFDLHMRLRDPVAYSMPLFVEDICPCMILLADAIHYVAHELGACFVKLVQSLSKTADAKRAALANRVID